MMRNLRTMRRAPEWFVPDDEQAPLPDRRAYQRGFERGWWAAAAFYVVMSVVAVLAFHALGVHP